MDGSYPGRDGAVSTPAPRSTKLGVFHAVPLDSGGYRWDLACAGCGTLLVLSDDQWFGCAPIPCTHCSTVAPDHYYANCFMGAIAATMSFD